MTAGLHCVQNSQMRESEIDERGRETVYEYVFLLRKVHIFTL